MDTEKEAHVRSIMKAVSYRLGAAVVTTSIAFVFTRRIAISVGIGAAEAIGKIILYYLHERLWSLVRFGQAKHPLSFLDVSKELTEHDKQIITEKLKELGYIGEE